MEHLNIRVSGRVQGVFFRASAKKKAEELGLTGLARNESDGSVHLEVEGTPERLREFLSWCRRGTRKAKVEQVEFAKGELQRYQEFKVN